jgi:uncharacterized coiled-coil protein SlyX
MAANAQVDKERAEARAAIADRDKKIADLTATVNRLSEQLATLIEKMGLSSEAVGGQ